VRDVVLTRGEALLFLDCSAAHLVDLAPDIGRREPLGRRLVETAPHERPQHGGIRPPLRYRPTRRHERADAAPRL
jgi:hypothetical protein